MPATEGTFIMYSAGVGQTALDRLSDADPNPNSVFTRSLIPLLQRVGLSLTQTARAVRREVQKLADEVSHDQRPAYYDEVTGDFFFAGKGQAQPSAVAGTPAVPSSDDSVSELQQRLKALEEQLKAKDEKPKEEPRVAVGTYPETPKSEVGRGMQWSTGTYADGANRRRETAYLTYGIPETDAAQFSATCPSGRKLDTAPAILGYNIGKLRENARVDVLFLVNGQQVYQKPGRVYGTKLEQGATGVRFHPSFHDYFWQVLSRGGSLDYRIERLETATISLGGSAGAIQLFTEKCKAIQTRSIR